MATIKIKQTRYINTGGHVTGAESRVVEHDTAWPMPAFSVQVDDGEPVSDWAPVSEEN